MKRFSILFMILGLVAGSVATAEAAGKAKVPTRIERTVEASYIGPWLPFGNWDCSPTAARGCVSIATRARESYLSARVTDTHGHPVLVSVWSETEASGASPIFYGHFCGETTDPIRFPAGVTLKLWVGWWGPGLPSCGVGMATTGTVSATLSNLP